VKSGRKSRAELHALLDAILDLAPFAGEPGEKAEMAARNIGTALVREAFGWTEPDRPTLARDWDALHADPITWRREIIVRLLQASTPLPRKLVIDLANALAELQKGDGEAPALLQPIPKAHWGRGRNPRDARECEEMILCRIAWECGKGRKPMELVNEAAQAVHRTPKTVEAWRKDWMSRAGAHEVEEELARWRRRGERGEAFSEPPLSFADMAGLWLSARDPREDSGKA
jgi:hypothetical protein